MLVLSVALFLQSSKDRDRSANLFMRHMDCRTSCLDIFLKILLIFVFLSPFYFMVHFCTQNTRRASIHALLGRYFS